MSTDPSPVPSPRAARSFGGVAEAYDRGRPGYPEDAARWLLGLPPAADGETVARPLRVLELGAGTGKLTAALVGLGHDVHATEPDPAMLDLLARLLPDVPVTQAGAESLPFPDGGHDTGFDVVVAAQCFHWFDPAAALPEIGRVMRTGGLLSLVWNLRDERVPWVRRLGPLLGTQDQGHRGSGSAAALDEPDWLDDVERASYSQWQSVDKVTIRDLALSRSSIATLDAERREARLAEVQAFYEEYGRGMDGMKVPYVVDCFRARLRHRDGLPTTAPEVTDDADVPDDAEARADEQAEHAADAPEADDSASDASPTDPPHDDDSGVLLIDYR